MKMRKKYLLVFIIFILISFRLFAAADTQTFTPHIEVAPYNGAYGVPMGSPFYTGGSYVDKNEDDFWDSSEEDDIERADEDSSETEEEQYQETSKNDENESAFLYLFTNRSYIVRKSVINRD